MSDETFFSRFSYRSGAVRLKDLAYGLASDDNLSREELPNTIICSWDEGKWFTEEQLKWSAITCCVVQTPKQQLVAVGPDGDVAVLGEGEFHEERVFDEQEEWIGLLREVRDIEGKAYVCGTNGLVYRRDSKNSWVAMTNGLPNEDGKGADLESLHGFSPRDIYAVGWGGVIWHYNGRRWRTVSSPTNLLLTRVLCAGDGNVYACGQAGTLLVGLGDKWKSLLQDTTNEDFWDLEWFEGRLYLSTARFLYALEDGELKLIDFGDDIPETCYHLSAADGVLWSFGPKDVMSFDGKEWVRRE